MPFIGIGISILSGGSGESPTPPQAATVYTDEADAMSLWLMRSKSISDSGASYFAYTDYTLLNIMVSKFDHTTKDLTLTDTGENGLLANAHASNTMFKDATNYFHVLIPGYTGGVDNIRIMKSTNPNDLSAWGSPVIVQSSGVTHQDFAYPQLHQIADGTLICTYRSFNASTSRMGVYKSVSSDGGATWGLESIILLGIDLSDQPYFDCILDANDRFHIAWHRYDGSTNNNLYYAYADDIEVATPAFKAVDGTALTTPLFEAATYRVFDSSAWDWCYIVGIDVSSAGVISIITMLNDAVATDRLSNFYYNSGWNEAVIVEDDNLGYGDAVFGREPSDGCVAFIGTTIYATTLMRTVNGELNTVTALNEYVSTDGGVTWAVNVTIVPSGTNNYTVPSYPKDINSGCRLVALLDGLHYNGNHDISYITVGDA